MSTITQTKKTTATHPAKRSRPATVRAHIPAVEPGAPLIERTPTAVADAVNELNGQEPAQQPFNPCTEREALAVTIGTPKRDERTITALIADWHETGEAPETHINIEIDGDPIACNPQQARASAAQLHQLANHLQVLAGKVEPVEMVEEEEGPFWLTQPCPTWCMGGHGNDVHYDDRVHYADTHGEYQFELSLHDCTYVPAVPASKTAHGREIKAYSYPEQIEVGACQHYRETGPVITLNVPEKFARDLRLTPAEARGLIASLIEHVNLVDPDGQTA
jgi:hypothetical protein